MKRALAVLVMALLASALIAGLSLVNLTQANPYAAYYSLFNNFETEPITDPPIVTLMSPRNGTPTQNATSIVFRVLMPNTWKWTSSYHTGNWSVFVGQIKSVTCSLDQNQILVNNTVYGRQHLETLRDFLGVIIYDKNIGFLAPGPHSLTIDVEAYTLYCYRLDLWCNVSVSSTFSFTVGVPPVVISLSLENPTYSAVDVPWVFSVDETAAWIGYSLDGQANVTANGNFTLTGLREGNHSIVLYANNTYGIMGRSDMVFFSVSPPTSALTYLIRSAIVMVVMVASASIVTIGLVMHVLRRKKKSGAA